MNIVLIGMSGSGKTTIGKELSKQLDRDFFDIDEMIVKDQGRTIDDIFKDQGEEFFRKLESGKIKEISNKKNSIISTGGGSILREDNMKRLGYNGYIVFLEGSIDTLIRNLESSDVVRPLLKNRNKQKNDMEKMYARRKELYLFYADSIINIDNKSVSQITEEITSLEEKEFD